MLRPAFKLSTLPGAQTCIATSLEGYVVLLIGQEARMAAGREFYPQVLGLGPERTDRRAGQTVRLYVGGIFEFLIEFIRPG